MKCYICGKLEPHISVKLQYHIPDGKHISKERWLQLCSLAKISKTTIRLLYLIYC